MPRPRAPWWMFVLAVSFLAFFILTTYCKLWEPESEGFQYKSRDGRMVLREVTPNSPAATAGLEPGDRVVSVDGHVLRTTLDWLLFHGNIEINRPLQLEVERDSKRFQTVLTLKRRLWTYLTVTDRVLFFVRWGLQLLQLILALVIAFSKPGDPVALLGAWVLATAATFDVDIPKGRAAVWRELPTAPGLLLWIPYISSYFFAGSIFFTFFANFPQRLFRARWAWALLWMPSLVGLALCLPWHYHTVYDPDHMASERSVLATQPVVFAGIAYFLAGLVALIVNYRRLKDINERRRVRVLVLGSTIALLANTPWLTSLPPIREIFSVSLVTFFHSLPAQLLASLLGLAFPLSFAYAILHHRLFDIRVMIRQGLQYAVARSSVLSLVPGLAAVLLVDLILHSHQPLIAILGARGWIYGALAGLAFLVHSRRKHWLEAVDRHFFREHYDAQRVLRDVVEEVRVANSFERAAPRVVGRIEAALHPEFVALLVRDPREPTFRTVAAAPVGQAPPSLIAESKLVSMMRVLGKPLDISSAESSWLSQQLPHAEADFVRQACIELLIPIAMSLERKEALLALGHKRSEEPYSQEDQNLLVAIAGSLALLLERPTAGPLRVNNAFEECPQCGECYDTGSVSCAQEGASLVPVSLPRLLTGRYLLRRRRGRGGMGTVYEALDTALDRRVAVKVVRDDLTSSPVAAERFRQEARVAASFTHPNVVTVYDFGVVAKTRAFLVMELLEGVTLREELRKDGRFTTSRTLDVLRGVCTAIECAHRRQLVHRDLKPENVFLVRDDTGEFPKVVDFGLAKFLSTSPQETIDTDPGQAVGTMRYMAPEQLSGHEVDVAWDLWALTVMAYEMVTGANPFAGSTPAECYRTILAASFTPVSKHMPEAPRRWEEFFAQAFALDPADRPTSARMFISQLGRAFS